VRSRAAPPALTPRSRAPQARRRSSSATAPASSRRNTSVRAPPALHATTPSS
jgi:hypothetical protein